MQSSAGSIALPSKIGFCEPIPRSRRSPAKEPQRLLRRQTATSVPQEQAGATRNREKAQTGAVRILPHDRAHLRRSSRRFSNPRASLPLLSLPPLAGQPSNARSTPTRNSQRIAQALPRLTVRTQRCSVILRNANPHRFVWIWPRLVDPHDSVQGR